MGKEAVLSFNEGQQFSSSKLSLASGVSFDGSTNSNPLSFGLTNPNLPNVAGDSTFKVLSSETLGYLLLILSMTALFVFLYLWGRKKVVTNGISQE